MLRSVVCSTIVGLISSAQGTLIVNESSVINLLEYCSIEMEDDLNTLSESERMDVCKIVACFFLRLMSKSQNYRMKGIVRMQNQKMFRHLILLFQVISMNPKQLYSIVKQQKQNILMAWNEKYLVKLENKFCIQGACEWILCKPIPGSKVQFLYSLGNRRL